MSQESFGHVSSSSHDTQQQRVTQGTWMSQESFRSPGVLYVSLNELYLCHIALHVSRLYTGSFGLTPMYLSRTVFMLF